MKNLLSYKDWELAINYVLTNLKIKHMAKKEALENASKEVEKQIKFAQENASEIFEENVSEDNSPFKGMNRQEKEKVLFDMAKDCFYNSNKVLKEQKMHLNLFDERHPVIDAIIKNDTVIAYLEEFENEQ